MAEKRESGLLIYFQDSFNDLLISRTLLILLHTWNFLLPIDVEFAAVTKSYCKITLND